MWHYVRILHLAATTMPNVRWRERVRRLLESRVRFDYAVVKQLAAPAFRRYRHLSFRVRWTWAVYDRLLTGGAR